MNLQKFKIGVIDDHFAIRDGYKGLLEKWELISEIKTYTSLGEFYFDFKTINFDLIFMDIELHNENGLDACRTLKLQNHNLKIIILSAYHNEQYILNAYDSNADGYLFKDASQDEVKNAIITVLQKDEKYFNHEAISVIFKFQESIKKKNKNGKTELSEREIEILKLICQGKSNDQISSLINRTPATVATHRQNIMNKIGAHNGFEIINYALSNGLYIPYIKNTNQN
jgi:DNA-binding NarL/FixJ family response regulator